LISKPVYGKTIFNIRLFHVFWDVKMKALRLTGLFALSGPGPFGDDSGVRSIVPQFGSGVQIDESIFLTAGHVVITRYDYAGLYDAAPVNLRFGGTLAQGNSLDPTLTGGTILAPGSIVSASGYTASPEPGLVNQHDLVSIKSEGNSGTPTDYSGIAIVYGFSTAINQKYFSSVFLQGYPNTGTIDIDDRVLGPVRTGTITGFDTDGAAAIPGWMKVSPLPAARGESGGPAWINYDGQEYVFGVLTASYQGSPLVSYIRDIDNRSFFSNSGITPVPIGALVKAKNLHIGGDSADSMMGSYRRDIFDGGAGSDTIYTGYGRPDVLGTVRSGDEIAGGSGADTIVLGAGDHVIKSESAADRSGDRLAILSDAISGAATADGAIPDATTDSGFLIAGATFQIDKIQDNSYQYCSKTNVPNTNRYGPIGNTDYNVFIRIEDDDTNSYSNSTGRIHEDSYIGNLRVSVYILRANFFDNYISNGNPFGITNLWNVDTATFNSSAVWRATVVIKNYHHGEFGLDIQETTGTRADELTKPLVDLGNIDGFPPTGAASAPILGGPGSDTRSGTPGRDIIDGGAGNDILNGLGDVDRLYGGSGNDSLDGGSGNDLLVGDSGNDTYIVDSELDAVVESLGEGTDTVRSSVTIAALAASVENLILTGTTAINVTGNALANILTGNSADNTLAGGDGNDTINGASGNDSVNGGAGTDILVLSGVRSNYTFVGLNATQTRVTDSRSGGDGQDTIEQVETVQFSDGSFALSTLLANGQTITGTTGNDTLTGGSGNDTLNGLGGNDTLDGGDGNDTLDGGTGTDTLKGGLGNDVFIVDVSSDVVTELASAGTDEVRTALASYSLGANVENLTYTGTVAFSGVGNTLANTIVGAAGNDTLNGGAGTDTLRGGTGNDSYVVDSASDVVTENANAGTDTVQSSVTIAALATNVENLTLTGTTAINGTGNTLDNVLTGNSANNTLAGGDGNDTLNGGAGNDTLQGGLGNDVFIVDSAGDIVTEAVGAGLDEVRTALASYTLGTEIENLTFTGTAAFTGTGNGLANTMTGAAGDDTLNGGAGNDTLNGGLGDDWISGGVGADNITGGDGYDTVDFQAAAVAIVLDRLVAANSTGEAAGDTWATVERFNLTNFNDRFVGNSDVEFIFAYGGNDTILAGGGDDWIVGGVGSDAIDGGIGFDTANYFYATVAVTIDRVTAVNSVGEAAGDTFTAIERFQLTGSFNDRFVGNSDSEWVYGGGGTDTLIGNAGDDVLDGEEGNDTLTGGTGADTFAFYSTTFAKDTVTDFAAGTAGTDILEFSVSVFANFTAVQAKMTQVGADTVIALDVNNSVTLKNVTMSSFIAGDFTFL
jgi:Ca2+-binding RTX toxin-like protein